MPVEPFFKDFTPIILSVFDAAKSDGGPPSSKLQMELAEERRGFGRARAQFLIIEPNGPVRVTWAGIGSLWALSQGAARLARRMFEGIRAGKNQLDLEDDPELETGLYFYELSRRLCIADFPIPPSGLPQWVNWVPRPNPSAVVGTDDAAGNSFLRGALAWILRHEVAHFALDHFAREASEMRTRLIYEEEADREATKWLCERFRSDETRALGGALISSAELELERRAIAVGLGLVWVGFFEDTLGKLSGEHPPIAERMFKTLDLCKLREDSLAMEILANVIQSWIGPDEHWAPEGGYKDTREFFSDALSRLQRHMARHFR